MTNITFIKDRRYPPHFYRWVWKNVQKTYLRVLRPAKLMAHVKYLSSLGININTYKLYVLLCRYVLSGNLIEMKGHYQVFFSNRMRHGSITVSDLFKLVEYGNLSVRGSNILIAIKNDREQNIHRYWNTYRMLYEPGG